MLRDSDFPDKSEAMYQFFDKCGYPVSVVQAGYHRAQELIDSQDYEQLWKKTLIAFHSLLHFTLTTTQLNIILKNFKLLQNDSETGTIFLQPPLISFKRDKNMGNFLVRNSFQTSDQRGTFKCAHDAKLVLSFVK